MNQTRSARKVQREVRNAGVSRDAERGGGTLFSESVLVVNQKAKYFGANAEYAVFDRHGQQLGAVREVGQSVLKNMISSRPSQSRTRKFQIVDRSGRLVLTLTRPAKFGRSKMVVRSANGMEIGQIARKDFGILGNSRFDFEARGTLLGSVNGEGRGAWDFNVQDSAGTEIARITKTWAGLLDRDLSRNRDKYVVEIHVHLEEPLRSLVIATCLAVDTALRS